MPNGWNKSSQMADKLRWCPCGKYETAADDGLCGVCYAEQSSGTDFAGRLERARTGSMVDDVPLS